MTLREYRPADCGELVRLFYDTVHTVNAKDYTEEQLDAWASKDADMEFWNQTLLAHCALVAEEGDRIIGFGDIDQTGYLDRLFVRQDCQGRGVASALCDALEAAVPGKELVTHASITARPFFEKRGYHVVRKQTVERRGVLLANFVMAKDRKGSGAFAGECTPRT